MKVNKLLIGLTLVSFGGTLLVYNKLPEQIPVHWGIDGQIDRYGGRYTALITGALAFVMYLLMILVPKIDPRKDSYEKHGDAYKMITIVLVLFLIGLHWVVMAYSLGFLVDVVLFVKLGVGLLFIVLGNYLPVVRHNYTLGIRLPWTLANEEVWTKTHKVGGYAFALMGLIWFGLAFVNQPWVFYFLMGTLLVVIGGLSIYSYRLFQALGERRNRKL